MRAFVSTIHPCDASVQAARASHPHPARRACGWSQAAGAYFVKLQVHCAAAHGGAARPGGELLRTSAARKECGEAAWHQRFCFGASPGG